MERTSARSNAFLHVADKRVRCGAAAHRTIPHELLTAHESRLLKGSEDQPQLLPSLCVLDGGGWTNAGTLLFSQEAVDG